MLKLQTLGKLESEVARNNNGYIIFGTENPRNIKEFQSLRLRFNACYMFLQDCTSVLLNLSLSCPST